MSTDERADVLSDACANLAIAIERFVLALGPDRAQEVIEQFVSERLRTVQSRRHVVRTLATEVSL